MYGIAGCCLLLDLIELKYLGIQKVRISKLLIVHTLFQIGYTFQYMSV